MLCYLVAACLNILNSLPFACSDAGTKTLNVSRPEEPAAADRKRLIRALCIPRKDAPCNPAKRASKTFRASLHFGVCLRWSTALGFARLPGPRCFHHMWRAKYSPEAGMRKVLFLEVAVLAGYRPRQSN